MTFGTTLVLTLQWHLATSIFTVKDLQFYNVKFKKAEIFKAHQSIISQSINQSINKYPLKTMNQPTPPNLQ